MVSLVLNWKVSLCFLRNLIKSCLSFSSSIALQEQNVQLTNDRSVINTYRDKNEVKGAADQGNWIIVQTKQ